MPVRAKVSDDELFRVIRETSVQTGVCPSLSMVARKLNVHRSTVLRGVVRLRRSGRLTDRHSQRVFAVPSSVEIALNQLSVLMTAHTVADCEREALVLGVPVYVARMVFLWCRRATCR